MDAQHISIEDLKTYFLGTVLTEGDAAFDGARQLWNAMIDRRPTVIARCRGTADVIQAVRFARAQGLPVAIRGGGHNVAGHGACDTGVMIDLSQMRAVHVDPDRRIAVVEGGATWAEVDRETQAFGLATPGGLISETGVAGLTLSGGFGYLRGRHGLTIDNLVAADVVTADGTLVRASADQNPDLLWALKGGGGNFGVVVRFEFALHPVGPEVMFIAPIYAVEDGPGPIRAWRDYVAEHDKDLAMICEFSTVPEDDGFPRDAWGKKVFALVGIATGAPDAAEALARPLRELGPLVTDFSGRMAYTDIQRLFDAQTPFGEMRCYWKARYLTDLPDAMIDLAMENASRAPSPNTISSLWNMGSAVRAVPAEASAFGDRSMGWMYSADGVWADAADDAANIAWARDSWSRAEPFGHQGRAYLNFPGHGEDGTLTRDAFGDSYDRLARIKAKYDPDNVFRFNQNIAPSA
ncbi:FAD-binding oxidoreductase [Limibaculum sp. FT325]|uniref:FAD-binding oxidoreductase n=1 Tax=Thermohalobaculum sediminis TaxID=2939436 RepID=UPI0020C16C0F|nr:FAD-binding oxidoreductase [Limibaculum sediminis]MCL5776129.1 FAD-binding oxidoreductase [Limibaculum sediminis]